MSFCRKLICILCLLGCTTAGGVVTVTGVVDIAAGATVVTVTVFIIVIIAIAIIGTPSAKRGIGRNGKADPPDGNPPVGNPPVAIPGPSTGVVTEI